MKILRNAQNSVMLEMVTPFLSIFCTNATLIGIEFYSALISIIEVMISKLH